MDTPEVLQKKRDGSQKRWDATKRSCRFCEQDSGKKTVCPSCYPEFKKSYNREYMAKRRYEAIKRGNCCTSCTKEIDSDDGRRRYCDDCRSRQNLRRDEKVTAGFCRLCMKRDRIEDRVLCQQCANAQKRSRDKLKFLTIVSYGGECACCGESDHRFLNIDHVENDGFQERRAISRTGNKTVNFYSYLKTKGFPQGPYQVLCWNCNMAKAHFGSCPHLSPHYPLTAEHSLEI